MSENSSFWSKIPKWQIVTFCTILIVGAIVLVYKIAVADNIKYGDAEVNQKKKYRYNFKSNLYT
jgi:hypothetical protein